MILRKGVGSLNARTGEDLDPVGYVHTTNTVYKDLQCKHVLPFGSFTLSKEIHSEEPYLGYECPWCGVHALLSFDGLKVNINPEWYGNTVLPKDQDV